MRPSKLAVAADGTSVQLVTNREALFLTPAQAREAAAALNRFADLVERSVLKGQPGSTTPKPSESSNS